MSGGGLGNPVPLVEALYRASSILCANDCAKHAIQMANAVDSLHQRELCSIGEKLEEKSREAAEAETTREVEEQQETTLALWEKLNAERDKREEMVQQCVEKRIVLEEEHAQRWKDREDVIRRELAEKLKDSTALL